MLRRTSETRHPAYLVLKARPGDTGARPLAAPFASPEITVGPDGRPRVLVWNLGLREVTAVTEFHAIPAGLPVRSEHARPVGAGNPAIIGPGQAVVVTCNGVWSGPADVLIVMAYHPELDPVQRPFDAQADRHVGQMNYPWVGAFVGRVGERPVRVEIRPAPQGLYRVRLYEGDDRHPRCDRIMKPHGHTFRWLEVEGDARLLFELALVENDRMTLGVGPRGGDPESGLLDRVAAS